MSFLIQNFVKFASFSLVPLVYLLVNCVPRSILSCLDFGQMLSNVHQVINLKNINLLLLRGFSLNLESRHKTSLFHFRVHLNDTLLPLETYL